LPMMDESKKCRDDSRHSRQDCPRHGGKVRSVGLDE
jgi:hypothetical protein